MAIDFKLPELGENITSGDVTKILVREGDTIEANDGVIELETDKAVVEIPCPHGGRISKIHVRPGESVKVGQTVLTVESEEQPAAAPAAPLREKPAESRPEVAEKTKPSAEEALRGEPKPEVTARAVADKPPLKAAPAPPAAKAPVPEPIPAGPTTRRLARELGVDLAALAGSGPRGRITPEDVQAASGAPAAEPGAAPQAVVPPGEPGEDPWGPVRRERISKIRRTIADQMVRSASTIPHVTNFDDADVTELEQLRKSIPEGYLGKDIKLTMMPLLIKAVARALTRHPAVNASIDDQNEQIVYKQYVNIGVAVDTPRGLVVPVLRGADHLSISEIARAVSSIAQRARAAQFAVEDLRGGTFTISNMGAVGGAYATPIINHPEVAILLIGRTRWMPVVREGKIEPRFMMPLSLSYDHRLVDGATAARFLNEVIDCLQLPAKLLIAP